MLAKSTLMEQSYENIECLQQIVVRIVECVLLTTRLKLQNSIKYFTAERLIVVNLD